MYKTMDRLINKIICGDCMFHMAQFPANYIDLVLTDIPYGTVNKAAGVIGGVRNLHKGDADNVTFELEPFLYEINRICRGSIYIFCSTEQVSFIRQYFVDMKLSTRHCIWEKTDPSPMLGQYMWTSGFENCIYAKNKNATFNEYCKPGIWKCHSGKSDLHPTQKPIKLFKRLVAASSNPGDIVFDPCIGSGTTGAAALRLGRRFIGIDISPEYCNLARGFVGQKDFEEWDEASHNEKKGILKKGLLF